MEILDHLVMGFAAALSWQNLLWCLIGVTLGTLIGVLPGLGTMAAISILLPFTYGISDATASIIFLAGIYYGTQYGGSTTSILLRLPGEPSSVVTVLDGYAMTQNGRGGAALAIAALASFFAGTVATILIMFLAKPLAILALKFGPAEYAALMLLGIIASVSLSSQSYIKGISAAVLGMLLGLIGIDINSGTERFTLGTVYLMNGISFATIAMGVFGLAEVLYNLLHGRKNSPAIAGNTSLYPSRQELAHCRWPTIRGTAVGSLLGLFPGGGALISSFASYALEKKLSKNPGRFGQGDPAGVAAPEAANNAGAQTSFIPMLSTGIPITPVMALMAAALMIQGIEPGPQIVQSNSQLFWALIASMWIGNVFLLVLNLPLIPIWISVLRVRWFLLYPVIVAVCVWGAYSINNNWFDVGLLAAFTVLGYVFKILKCDPTPLAMGFIIGKFFEEHLRRALMISRGDWMIFLEKPISLTFLMISVSMLLIGFLIRKKIHA